MPRIMVALLLCVSLAGCMEPKSDTIMNKKTQDVGKFDPNAANVVSDSKVRIDPLTPGGAVQAYGPMVEQIMKSHVMQAVNLFQAENDRYPKDYDEFMEKIIKANNIQLPVLPGGKKYQYDEANHILVVVDGPVE